MEMQPMAPAVDVPGPNPESAAPEAPEAPAFSDPDSPMTQEQQDALIAETQERFRKHLLEKYSITKEHLEQWKGQFGRIAAFPLYDDFYVIRALNRREWRVLMKPQDGKEMTDEDMEEQIANIATIYPQMDPSELRTSSQAGLATTLSRNIQMISGFVPGALPVVL